MMAHLSLPQSWHWLAMINTTIAILPVLPLPSKSPGIQRLKDAAVQDVFKVE